MAPEFENDVSSSPSLASSPSRKRKRTDPAVEEIEVDVTAPEPPSKKALRKAKKGKIPSTSTAPKPSSITDPNLDSDTGIHEQTALSKRSEHGIWIGNLPWTATRADLRTFLTKDASISEDMITRIHMPAPNEAISAMSRQKIKPQNKGFAYVDFSSDTAVTEAVALSEKLLTGRRVLIKDSKSFEGRPEKGKEDAGSAGTNFSGKPPSKRIFVGNLGFDTTKEDLQDHFARCGEVLDVHVATFEDSGKCKGYAWVEFDDLSAGEAVVRGWVDFYEEKSEEEEEEEEEEEGGSEIQNEKDVDNEIPMTAAQQPQKPKLKKKPRPRKWWVNKLKGRSLRMEFAEDKAVRYKKRYGKDGTAQQKSASIAASASEGPIADLTATEIHVPSPVNNAVKNSSTSRKVDARSVKPGAALAAAPRLTGGIVPSLGKKITFH